MRNGTYHHVDLLRMIRGSSGHCEILYAIGSMGLQDCWAAAGFVRSLVWDVLHERPPARTKPGWPSETFTDLPFIG